MGNEHALIVILGAIPCSGWTVMFGNTNAGRWEQAHMPVRNTEAGDTAGRTDDFTVADGPSNPARFRLYRTCHCEGHESTVTGDADRGGLIFTRLVSQHPEFKF